MRLHAGRGSGQGSGQGGTVRGSGHVGTGRGAGRGTGEVGAGRGGAGRGAGHGGAGRGAGHGGAGRGAGGGGVGEKKALKKAKKKALKKAKKKPLKTQFYLVKLTNVNSISRVGRHRLRKEYENARFRLHTISPAYEVMTENGPKIKEQSGKLNVRSFDCLPSRTLARLKVLAPSLVTGQTDEGKIVYQYQKHQRFKPPNLELKTFYRRLVHTAKGLLVRRTGLRSLNAFFADQNYERGNEIMSQKLAKMIRKYLGVTVNLTRTAKSTLAEIRILLDLDFEMIDHIEQRGLDEVLIKI